MTKNALDPIISALRGGASDLGGRTQKTVTQVASSVGRILDETGTEGAKIKKALVRNWTSLGRPRHSRAVPVLLGVLALGAATAYLLGRPFEPRG
ncbi:MAG TPA: hypothetical protein VFZ57_06300 [Thermoanaerobaculia bacterium]|nr:hypothetical protein [Thermoanaerobaculia bacterium]